MGIWKSFNHSGDFKLAKANFVSVSPKSVNSKEVTQTPRDTPEESNYVACEVDQNHNSDECVGQTRSMKECVTLLKTPEGVKQLCDEDIISLLNAKYISSYDLEQTVNDYERGVGIRRKSLNTKDDIQGPTKDIPFKNYNYTQLQGACCENVVGYIPVPLGVAGPLKVNGQLYHIPMATTEGCLVASTNRGCRALSKNGVNAWVFGDGMSRAPVVRFSTAGRAVEAKAWLSNLDNIAEIKQKFDSSSKFARLVKIDPKIAGHYMFIRFAATTGDAMGMNMISKGVELALNTLQNTFPDMKILSISGNVCTDKKPAAINWLEGRGKSVVAEAVIPAEVIEKTLKTTASALVELNIAKNLIGSAVAGSVGGFNAHAANVVTAVYIACGQDPAQNVVSSNCITIMETHGASGEDLYISCTMPSIECGTIGGGTILPAQAGCLEMLGITNVNQSKEGENSKKLACIVAAAVLAGELSLMAALASGQLVSSHMKHNRSNSLISNADMVTQSDQ